ncbi:MAG TPA: PTS sugar transporter subunit IIA, partial [Spirochaetia bacterium]|nr:PTS sugar transporter subunit IIA [Spirochaetia bacterium]
MADTLVDALDASCVALDMKAKRKPELVAELVDLLAQAGKIDDADEVIRKVLEREELTSTGIGGGIAIPHCLSPAASQTHIAFGRKKSGARF